MSYTHVNYQAPDNWADHHTISGDLRAPGTGMDDDANYEARDALQGAFPLIDFDPESSCFYAYAKDFEQADAFAKAVDQWAAVRRGEPVASPVECPTCRLSTGRQQPKMGGTFLMFDCPCDEVRASLGIPHEMTRDDIRQAVERWEADDTPDLGDLSALVQIPAVRELIQWLQYEEPIQNTYLEHDTPLSPWIEALEATR